MRIAHLIMAYKNPSQLERLIKRLNHPKCYIYIHLDKKVNIQCFKHLAKIKRVVFIHNRVTCNWAGFSFVKAITNSIKEILLKDEEYQHINLLSAQDYPIKPVDVIYQYLKKNKGVSFISFETLGQSEWWEHAKTRYEYFHFVDINISGKYLAQHLINKVISKRKFPVSYQLYGSASSSWWTISVDCAQHIVDFLDHNPKLTKFMRYTWAADEFLYPTIVMNSHFKNRVVNNNLRLIEWEQGKPNPHVYCSSDFSVINKSEMFFARKFDTEIDSKILDQIDELIDAQ